MTQPLDSHEACRYLWINWRVIGMHPFATHRRLYWCYSVMVNLCFSILYPLHLLLQLFFTSDFMRIMFNLSISLTLTNATLKQMVIFYYSQTKLQQVRVHVRALDKRAASNGADRALLEDTVSFCHRMYYIYMGSYWTCLSCFILFGYFRHNLIFEGYFPFDWTLSLRAYHVALFYQIISTSVQLVQNLTDDIYTSTYLKLLVTHFQVLNRRVARLGEDSKKSLDQNYQELLDCIRDHKECMKFYDCVQPVISRTMLLQFTVTGFVLCVTAIIFFNPERSFAQYVTTFIYLNIVIIEVMPCCWFVNELISETSKLTTALYSCRWYEQNLRFRKTLIIFMQRSQKTTVIMAGNQAPVTLQTFMAIVRFSFSMFTILSQQKF